MLATSSSCDDGPNEKSFPFWRMSTPEKTKRGTFSFRTLYVQSARMMPSL